MTQKTISQNLALYRAAHDKRLRQIRRELQQAQRRYWFLRIKQLFRRKRKQPDNLYVIHL
jgi:hypothetical protein